MRNATSVSLKIACRHGQRRLNGTPRLTNSCPNPFASILYIYMMVVGMCGFYALYVIDATIVLRAANAYNVGYLCCAVCVGDHRLGENALEVSIQQRKPFITMVRPCATLYILLSWVK